MDEMEPGFLSYLHTFFQDEGNPFFADVLMQGAADVQLGDLVADLKRVLRPEQYKKLIENSFYYAPPYWPLFHFVDRNPRKQLPSLLFMEWEDITIQKEFEIFITKYYSNKVLKDILDNIGKLVLRN